MSQNKKKQINLYNIRRKNSMQSIDWMYYTKFYPEKTVAVTTLHVETDLSMEEAREVIDEIYSRVERGEVEPRKRNAQYSGTRRTNSYSNYGYSDSYDADTELKEDMKKIGKGLGCGFLVVVYTFLSAIFALAGVSAGRKRRRRRW